MIRLLACLTLLAASVTTATAQEQRRPSHCIAIVDAAPGLEYIQLASWQDPIPEFSVRLSYVSHASFLLQTRGGLNAVTDFTGFIGNVDLVPDIVTMNHAHSSHWTQFPDPAIPYVLRGWGETFGAGIDHYLDLGEMLIRNVSTNIRSPQGGVEEKGNSIFVFEVEGLCIGHMGHLHHEPTDEQYAALGRLDVVMVAVDGGMTMPISRVVPMLERLRSSVVIPMHWFSDYGLERFLGEIGGSFEIDRRDTHSMEISLRTLPDRPTVVVLRPAYLR
jgi:L-ascorbate metabolism protein UlaG (beta-lactamase superfamily)